MFFGNKTFSSVAGNSVPGDLAAISSNIKDIFSDGAEILGINIGSVTPEKAIKKVRKATSVLKDSMDDVKEASQIIFAATGETSPDTFFD